jgi:predicted transcriptional regulator
MPSATTALGYTTITSTQSQSANNNEGNQMTINDQIANEIILAEAEDKSLREWGEIIDNFAHDRAEEMTYGWELEDEEFDSFKNSLREAIMAHVDLNKVQEIIEQNTENAIERVNEMLNRTKDMRGL